MYIPTDLSITGPQLVRLYKGHPVQISANGLKTPNSRVLMHPIMSKHVEACRKKNTGCRIVMSPYEIMQTGSRSMTGSGRMAGLGFWDSAWDALKKAAKWVGDTAVPYLVENVPKAARYVKDNIIDSELYQSKLRPKVEGLIMDKLSGLPYADTTKDLAQSGFDISGIGMKKPKAKPAPQSKAKAGRVISQRQTKGGSFRVN